jgi:hypothetical protein
MRKFSALVYLLFLIGCGGGSSSGNGGNPPPTTSWTALGIPFSTGVALAFDSGGHLYAASNGGGGVARSSDGGQSWSTLNTGLASSCELELLANSVGEMLTGDSTCAASNPTPFAAHSYRLMGNGSTWTQGTPTFNNWVSPDALNGAGNILAGTQSGQGIYISTDNGSTYAPVPGNLPPPAGMVLDIEKAPNGTLYAGVEVGGVYQSTDDGLHWNQLGVPTGSATANTFSVGFNPQGELLVSRGGQGIYCWSGSSWSNCSSGLVDLNAPGGLKVWEIKLNNSKTQVYAASNTGVYTSTDGHSWTSMSGGIPVSNPSTGATDCHSLVFDSSGFGYVITHGPDAGNGPGGVFKTIAAQ